MFSTPKNLVADLQFAIVVFAVQVLVDQLTNAAEAALDGLQRVDLSRGVDAFRRTAVSVSVAVVAVAGGGLEGVAVASLAGSLVGAVLSGATLHHQHRGRWARPRVSDMRGLLSYGKSIAVLQPLGVITRQMDRLIAGTILGPAAVTLVEIATQVQNGASAVLAASLLRGHAGLVLGARPRGAGPAARARAARDQVQPADHLPGDRRGRHPGSRSGPCLGRDRPTPPRPASPCWPCSTSC